MNVKTNTVLKMIVRIVLGIVLGIVFGIVVLSALGMAVFWY